MQVFLYFSLDDPPNAHNNIGHSDIRHGPPFSPSQMNSCSDTCVGAKVFEETKVMDIKFKGTEEDAQPVATNWK